MSIAIRIEVEGTNAVIRGLQEVRARGLNLVPALKLAGKTMERSIAENFEQEGRPVAWKPLAAATLRKRRRQGGPSRILQDGGFLKGGIKYVVEGNAMRIGPTGPAAVYARIHQLGGQAGRGKKVTIPARPYLLFQDEDVVEIEELIRRHILGAAHG